ncbi:MAG: nickel-type superoxide dismutase maturation protease [Dehalococcoidia bacterium]|nr:nickel-type superoxide dismutase maturation protease [Dehalococcoidia bacterium]
MAAPGGRRRSPSPAIAGSLVTFAATVAAGALIARRYTRYCVRGVSMEPAFRDGDFVVVDRAAYRRAAPKAGQVVIATDPREPARTVVKRAAEVTDTDVTLRGDNAAHSTDSRTYGPIPRDAVIGRVVFRYWPLRR